jgi:hypothetical protein
MQRSRQGQESRASISSEPGLPAEPFMREVRRLIVTSPREATTNIMGMSDRYQ